MPLSTFTWQSERKLKIFAQNWQPEGKPRGVVSLVHGLGEHIGRYQYVAEAFNAAGFGLVACDLPGHGRSEGARGGSTFDQVLPDIDCLLAETADRYKNVPHFLYGHSMGAGLVLYYTLKRRPVLKGVIASAPPIAAGAVPAVKVLLARVVSRLAPGFTMDNGLDLNNLSRDPAVIQAYKEDPLVHPKISTGLGWDLLSKGNWILAQAAEFPLPLLLIQGSADHIVSPEATAAFAKAVPQDKLTFKVWEGQYHETHNEPEKQQALQYIIDWLNSQL